MADSIFMKKIRNKVGSIMGYSQLIKENLSVDNITDDVSLFFKIVENAVDFEGFEFSGLYLIGPEGSGRHTAANKFIGSVLKRHAQLYEVIFLNGRDLDFSDDDVRQFEEEKQDALKKDPEYNNDDIVDLYFDELFGPIAGDERKIILVLDEIGNSRFSDRLLYYLGKAVRFFNSEDEKMPGLFLILIDENELRLPSDLRNELTFMRFTLPDQKQREYYLKRAGIKPELSGVIANHTEGFNFNQLKSLSDQLRVYNNSLFEDESLSSEICLALIKNNSPLRSEEEIVIDDKKIFYNKLGTFVDLLPELLEKMGQSRVEVKTVSSNKNDQVQPGSSEDVDFDRQLKNLDKQMNDDAKSIEEECKNMTIMELAFSALGEERMKNIKIE